MESVPNDKEQKLAQLKQARSEYRTIAIDHLSFSNNLFLTLSIGFLAFVFDKDKPFKISLRSCLLADTANGLFLLFSFLSILVGIAVVFSRLYDFRITRYIVGIRVKMFENHNVRFKHTKFDKPTFFDKTATLLAVLLGKSTTINQTYIKEYQNNKSSFKKEFNDIRKTEFILGEATISWIKWQALFLVLSLACFIISLF